MKHRENVAVISSNNSLLYLKRTGSQRYAWSCHFFCITLEAGIYCENKGSIEKTRDLWEIESLLIANHILVFYVLVYDLNNTMQWSHHITNISN